MMAVFSTNRRAAEAAPVPGRVVLDPRLKPGATDLSPLRGEITSVSSVPHPHGWGYPEVAATAAKTTLSDSACSSPFAWWGGRDE